MRVFRRAAPALLVLAVAGSALAQAKAPEESSSTAQLQSGQQRAVAPAGQGVRSKLEISLIEEALAHHSLQADPRPEGKKIENIVVYVAKVFDDRDPIPNALNVFHTRTRDFMVRQEVLQSVGDTWEIGRILETERNLRSIRQLSLANVVAAKGSDDESIVLLVVVKDVWSLRLNSSWAVGSAGLNYLLLNPTEENLAGLRISVGFLFELERDRYSLGGIVSYPRLPGSRYSVLLHAGAYQNRHSGASEGSFGSFVFQLPQYSRHSPWAYGSTARWNLGISRQYQDGQIAQAEVLLDDGSSALVPWVYDAERIDGAYWGRRSFGVEQKEDVEFGLDIDHRLYRTRSDANVSPEAEDAFAEQILPVSDTRISPYITLRAYETRFLRGVAYESLGLQEDIRLGYGVSSTIFAGNEALGSSRNLFGVKVSAGYTWALGDGLLRLGASNRTVVGSNGKDEGYFSAQGRFISPRTFLGRLHLDSYWGIRYEDYLNVAPFRLGANNRLRGYAPEAFAGKNVVVNNAEFRTMGVDILSAQVGLAAFYDLGAVDDDFAELQFRQAAGTGIRIVFPQAERTVLRLDWGVPLSGDVPVLPGAFYFTFSQAFPLPLPVGGGDPFCDAAVCQQWLPSSPYLSKP